MKTPYEPSPTSVLQRIADRAQAGGVAESILAQIETNEPIDRKRIPSVLKQCCDAIVSILDQSLYLEKEVAIYQRSLDAEKRLNVDLKMINRKAIERNAELEKENRKLKQNIEQWMK